MRWFHQLLRIKLHLQRQKWKLNETLILFKIVPMAFNSFILVSFPLVKPPLKPLFWYSIFLSIFSILSNLTVEVIFQFTKEEKVVQFSLVSMEGATLAQSYVFPKILHSKSDQDCCWKSMRSRHLDIISLSYKLLGLKCLDNNNQDNSFLINQYMIKLNHLKKQFYYKNESKKRNLQDSQFSGWFFFFLSSFFFFCPS